MKQLFAAIIIILAFPVTLGLINRAESHPTSGAIRTNEYVFVWVDPETKCEYLSNNTQQSSLTPRLDRNRQHICR